MLVCEYINIVGLCEHSTVRVQTPSNTPTSISAFHSISLWRKYFVRSFSFIFNFFCPSSIACSDWMCFLRSSCVHNHKVHRCTCTCSEDTEILYNQ